MCVCVCVCACACACDVQTVKRALCWGLARGMINDWAVGVREGRDSAVVSYGPG